MKKTLTVEPFEFDRFLVQSETRDLQLLVDLNHEGHAECGCEDFQIGLPRRVKEATQRGLPLPKMHCKHIRAVCEFLKEGR